VRSNEEQTLVKFSLHYFPFPSYTLSLHKNSRDVVRFVKDSRGFVRFLKDSGDFAKFLKDSGDFVNFLLLG